MPTPAIRARAVASRDGRDWDFHLINDSDVGFDQVILDCVVYNFGDSGNSVSARTAIGALAPGKHAKIWRDDDDAAESQMDLHVVVEVGDRVQRLTFEFPKLYRIGALPEVPGLGLHGYVLEPLTP